jgi:glycine oxidase
VSSATSPDVAVLGGGPIGLAVAWRAAQRGLRVVLADPRPGRGAAWAAAGMLAPVTETHPGEETLLALNLRSAAAWPAFAEELQAATALPLGYRADGTLTVARDRDDLEWLEDLRALQQSQGLAVERLSGRECRELEPSLAAGTRGGLLAPGDRQVDSRLLTAALLRACALAGVVVHEQEASLRVAGGRAAGLGLADGTEIAAERVVLAAGAWSARVPGVPPGLLPVRPVKGQIVFLRDAAGLPIASRNIRGAEVYLAPRADGRVAVGATMEERGFDAVPTAGAVHELLRAARELLPGIDELAFDEVVVGWRPATPDNAPLLGPTGLDGLLAATGHHRNGILLTPATAGALADCLAGDGLPDWAGDFDARRFAAVEVG